MIALERSQFISESLRKVDYKIQFAEIQKELMRAASGAGTGSPDRVYQVTDFEICDLWNENCDEGDELATLHDLKEWQGHAKTLLKAFREVLESSLTGDIGLVRETLKDIDRMSVNFIEAENAVDYLIETEAKEPK